MITPMTQGFARDLSVVMNKNVLMKIDNKQHYLVAVLVLT